MRQRATALVFRNGKVLLVREKNCEFYNFPGGEIEPGESTIDAAARELYEETHLHCSEVGRLRNCDCTDSVQHHVCLLITTGRVRLNHSDLSGYLWWDRSSHIPCWPHVEIILNKLKDQPQVPLETPSFQVVEPDTPKISIRTPVIPPKSNAAERTSLLED